MIFNKQSHYTKRKITSENRNIIVLIILISLPLLVIGCAEDVEVSFSSERNQYWIEDLEYITNTLPILDKDLFKNMNEKDFISKIEELKRDIPTINDDEIQIRLMEIFTFVKDEHLFIVNFHSDIQKIFSTPTFVNISLESSLKNILPVKTRWFGNDLYITETDEAYDKILGTKVIKIDNQTVEYTMKEIAKIIPHNNQQRVKFLFPMHIAHPQVLEHFDLMKHDYVTFTLEDNNGKVFKQKVKIMSIKDIKFKSLINKNLEGPLYTRKDDLYWYEYNPQNHSLYFRLSTYGTKILPSKKNFGQDDAVTNSTQLETFDDYPNLINDMISIMENDKIEKVIIDLRDNNGGYINKLDQLYNYLKNNERLNKQGKIFIIVNKGSFSAPIIDCMRFKEMTKAIIIGEPTGERPFEITFPGADTIILPNSKLSILYSAGEFKPIDENMDTFTPDQIIEETIDDYKQGVDSIIEAIFNYY